MHNLQARRIEYEQEGRERYLDLSPEQRKAVLADMIKMLNKGNEHERCFARGFLNEQRDQNSL